MGNFVLGVFMTLGLEMIAVILVALYGGDDNND